MYIFEEKITKENQNEEASVCNNSKVSSVRKYRKKYSVRKPPTCHSHFTCHTGKVTKADTYTAIQTSNRKEKDHLKQN